MNSILYLCYYDIYYWNLKLKLIKWRPKIYKRSLIFKHWNNCFPQIFIYSCSNTPHRLLVTVDYNQWLSSNLFSFIFFLKVEINYQNWIYFFYVHSYYTLAFLHAFHILLTIHSYFFFLKTKTFSTAYFLILIFFPPLHFFLFDFRFCLCLSFEKYCLFNYGRKYFCFIIDSLTLYFKLCVSGGKTPHISLSFFWNFGGCYCNLIDFFFLYFKLRSWLNK